MPSQFLDRYASGAILCATRSQKPAPVKSTARLFRFGKRKNRNQAEIKSFPHIFCGGTAKSLCWRRYLCKNSTFGRVCVPMKSNMFLRMDFSLEKWAQQNRSFSIGIFWNSPDFFSLCVAGFCQLAWTCGRHFSPSPPKTCFFKDPWCELWFRPTTLANLPEHMGTRFWQFFPAILEACSMVSMKNSPVVVHFQTLKVP